MIQAMPAWRDLFIPLAPLSPAGRVNLIDRRAYIRDDEIGLRQSEIIDRLFDKRSVPSTHIGKSNLSATRQSFEARKRVWGLWLFAVWYQCSI